MAARKDAAIYAFVEAQRLAGHRFCTVGEVMRATGLDREAVFVRGYQSSRVRVYNLGGLGMHVVEVISADVRGSDGAAQGDPETPDAQDGAPPDAV